MKDNLSQIWYNIQYRLFPLLEEEYPLLSKQHRRLSEILEVIRIESHLPDFSYCIGRPRKQRTAIARSFIAKIVFKLSFTSQLRDYLLSDKQLRRICGWESVREVPSESTFSRAFEEFARINLPELVHQKLIKATFKDTGTYAGHVTKDSVPVEARERAKIKSRQKKKEIKNKVGRPKKGETRAPKEPTRIKKQFSGTMTLEEMIKDLPKECDHGKKTSPKGFTIGWKGYKLHAAVDDHCIPLAIIVSSASMHDSQAAIPLGLKANKVADNFYDLMDAAYSVDEIHQHSKSLGHIPISPQQKTRANSKEIETEKKARATLKWDPAEAIRYKKRAPAERFNAILKENYMGTFLRYRGHMKVTNHIMFSVLVLTAELLLKIAW